MAEVCVCCSNFIKNNYHLLSSVVVLKPEERQVTLKYCIEQVSGVSKADLKMTDKICEICEQELLIAYKFKSKVLQTQNISTSKPRTSIEHQSREDNIQTFNKKEIVQNTKLLKVEEMDEEILTDIVEQMEVEHNYNHHTIIKEDEEEEYQIEIVASGSCDSEADQCKIEVYDDYIEEEYLEEDELMEITDLPKKPSIVSLKKIVLSQPKLNAEIEKVSKLRPRKNNATWDCSLCEYKSKHSKKDLKVHMLRLHFPDEMQISCEFCHKRCATNSEYNTHVQKYHSGTKQAKAVCAICSEGFPTGTKLHAHMIDTHLEGNRIPCDLCNATFKTMTNLKLHKKLHDETNQIHECPICTKTFRISYYLTKHIKDAHSSNPKLFTCNECGQTAKSKKDIRLHLTRRHFPECKSHLCVDCGKMFETSHRLSDHIRSWHNRELRYECDICLRKFIHPASLRIHKSTHSTISPFSCEECGASFKNMIYLQHHKKIHVSTKDFGCSQCPQFFKTKGYLQTHIKNCHPVEELHCNICSTTYKNLIIFKNHIKMHQIGKAECEVCGKSYASLNNLRLHRKNAHGLTGKTEKFIIK